MKLFIFNFIVPIVLGISVGLLVLGEARGLLFVSIFIYAVSAILYSSYQNIFIYTILGVLFFNNYIFSILNLSSPFRGYIDEITTIGLLILFFINKSLSIKKHESHWIGRYLLLFIEIAIISACINVVSWLVMVNYLSSMLKPLIIFYIIVESQWSERQLKKLVWALFSIGGIQAAFVIKQTLSGVSLGMTQSALFDIGTGTLGTGMQHHVGYLLLIMLFLSFGLCLMTKKLPYFVMAIFFAFSFYLTHTYHALVFIPIVLCILLLLMFKKIPNTYIIWFLLLSVFFSVVMYSMGKERVEKIITADEWRKSGKVQSYQNLLLKLPSELSYIGILVGAGPGMYASEIAIKNKPPLYMKYVFKIISNMEHDAMASTWNFPWTSIIALLGELGLIGFVLYILILLRITYALQKVVISERYSPFWRGLSLGNMGAILFIICMAFIMSAFEDMNMTYPIYILASIILSLSRNYPKTLRRIMRAQAI